MTNGTLEHFLDDAFVELLRHTIQDAIFVSLIILITIFINRLVRLASRSVQVPTFRFLMRVVEIALLWAPVIMLIVLITSRVSEYIHKAFFR
jgi:hypothetical protein